MSTSHDDHDDQNQARGPDPESRPEPVSLENADHRADYADAAPDGVLAVDATGTIRYANAAARTLLGPTMGMVVGGSFGFPIGQGRVELELRTAEGRIRNAEMRVTPVTVDGEDRWVVSLRDVTEGTRQKAQIVEELRNIDDALAVTSHELRNPLTVLAGTVELMVDEWETLTPDEQLQQLRRIQRSIMRMAFTIDSILDAARITSGAFRPVGGRVNVLDLVLERLPELGDAAAGIGIEIPPQCEVSADPNHAWMVFANFLVNSLKYGEGPRTIRARSTDLHTTIEIEDHGPGVPAEYADTLFDRYTRVPRTDGIAGTGLGLWIARSIAEAYGGQVRYRKAEHGGAVFSCQLPRTVG